VLLFLLCLLLKAAEAAAEEEEEEETEGKMPSPRAGETPTPRESELPPVNELLLDRLIDCLLREELGGESPPDVSQAVLARAFPRRKRAWVWGTCAGLTAAAAVVIAVLVLRGGGGAPHLVAGGPAAYAVLLDGNVVERGTVVATAQAPANLILGGYARVEVAARSSVAVEGAEKDEGVSLRAGQVACEVDSNVGMFAVRTQAGTALVAGTKFSVRLLEENGTDGMLTKRMMVHVLAGTVLVTWAAGQSALAAGDTATVPPKAGESGVVTGVVTAKGDAWIDVKAAGAEKAERYTALWKGGLPNRGGGPDADMVAAIAKVKIGDRVEVKWTTDERKRVIGLSVQQAASRPGEGEGGTVTGAVTAKGENWVEVKADGAEKAERYVIRYVGGSPDKEVLAQIAKVKVGDEVHLKWTFQEHKRVLSITAFPAAP
jgi:uncharacterized OB-fold protein